VKILFDLNVLIDVACRWQRFPESLDLYNRTVRSSEHEGGFPACGFTTLYFVLSQEIGEASARAFLRRFQETLRAAPMSGSTIRSALLLQMKDLEDACVAATALEAGFEVIATRNAVDYENSPIPPRSPAEILTQL
jgi:hypothetical protein